MSTGSLGQGFSVAVGMATAGKMDGNPGRVYALCGDGELQEGIIWEAALSAAHRNLDNLVLIVDWNGLQIDGKVDDVKKVTPLSGKFQTFGWHVINVDGHSFPEILAALDEAKTVKGQPTAIIAKTHKGHGVSFMKIRPDGTARRRTTSSSGRQWKNWEVYSNGRCKEDSNPRKLWQRAG